MKSFSLSSDHRRQRHIEMLCVASAVVVLSFLLQVQPDERVAFVGLDNYPLPHTCVSRSLFGWSCPGCGLTRSFIHFAHGEWRASFQSHRVGWVLLLAILCQFPYRILSLRHPGTEYLGGRFLKLTGYTLIALLIGNWLFNLVAG